MRPRHILSAIAISAVMLGATATSAAGQQGGSAAPHHTRVLATYRFDMARRGPFPSIVTIADSAGTLVASARIPGERSARELMVTILDSDVILQGETPNGVLTLILNKQNEGGTTSFTTGRWSLGDEVGKLKGRARG